MKWPQFFFFFFFSFIKLAILFLSLDSSFPTVVVFILHTTFNNGANVFSLACLSLMLMSLAFHPAAGPGFGTWCLLLGGGGLEAGPGMRVKGTSDMAQA